MMNSLNWNGWQCFPVKIHQNTPSMFTYNQSGWYNYNDYNMFMYSYELQDVAWKLYDLVDDFKTLQEDATVATEKSARILNSTRKYLK